MQRYFFDGECMTPDDQDGAYVLHEDALAEIERLRAQIAEALEFKADFDVDDTDRTILRSYADAIAKMRAVLIRAYQQLPNVEK